MRDALRNAFLGSQLRTFRRTFSVSGWLLGCSVTCTCPTGSDNITLTIVMAFKCKCKAKLEKTLVEEGTSGEETTR